MILLSGLLFNFSWCSLTLLSFEPNSSCNAIYVVCLFSVSSITSSDCNASSGVDRSKPSFSVGTRKFCKIASPCCPSCVISRYILSPRAVWRRMRKFGSLQECFAVSVLEAFVIQSVDRCQHSEPLVRALGYDVVRCLASLISDFPSITKLLLMDSLGFLLR